MLAIIEQWGGDSCHRDNTSLYLLLVFVKAGLDAVILYLCWRKLYTSFISLCSLSVFLADMVMMFFLVNVYFLGATRSPVSLCFLLAYASAAYAALPLPMLAFGLLDYILADECISNQRAIYKTLRNIFLTVLMWTFAILYSSESAVTEMTQLEYLGGTTALVCEVQESMLILYFVLGLFIAIFATLLPFWSKILRWLREAERLSHQREECQEYQRSDLLLTFSRYETKSGEFVQESMRPPLWVSLTLCFSSVWIPYFIISMACLIFGFGVPAYLTINLLWLECTNSVMVGVLFWVKSKTQGPYSQIPENMCLWSVYWHLSKGTQMQQLPTAVFNPSKERETHCAI
ncbi:hypothetical protein LDENG_00296250 [Lucifuga dentata]|nr:hypothetical protein LDENG_00296250 [Lucifuga dentata]